MKTALLIILCFVLTTSHSQKLIGTWKGIMTKSGTPLSKSTLFYIDFDQKSDYIGYSREELAESSNYAVKKLKGNITKHSVKFSQAAIISKTAGRKKWCLMDFELTYDSISGYLEGKYSSKECRRVQGTVKLFKVDYELPKKESKTNDQSWFIDFLYDLKEGLNAPEIRKIERENFVFEPVYFDFDKAIIREESKPFLLRLIKVVKGHSDLRIKVTGHTDSDGTHSYNDGLSKRRAQSIIDFFVQNGIAEDRLEFDFKGEKKPADTNSTSQGKQNNRRVDFEFI